ncbi:MAG: hypothetical protein ACTJLM_03720 [Ehrlichia sp.]
MMLKFCAAAPRVHSSRSSEKPVLPEKVGPDVGSLPGGEEIRILKDELHALCEAVYRIVNRQCNQKGEVAVDFLTVICSACITSFFSHADALRYKLSTFINDESRIATLSVLIPASESTLCKTCKSDFMLGARAINSKDKRDRVKALSDFCKSVSVVVYDDVVEENDGFASIIRLLDVVSGFLLKVIEIKCRLLKLEKGAFASSEIERDVEDMKSLMVSTTSVLRRLKTVLYLMKLEKVRSKSEIDKTLTLGRIPKEKKHKIDASHSFSGGEKRLPVVSEEGSGCAGVLSRDDEKDFVYENTSHQSDLDTTETVAPELCVGESVSDDHAAQGAQGGASTHCDVGYDPCSDVMLCKIDEHSIKSCLMSESGRDMLMRKLILEVGNRSRLIRMLSSEISVEKLKVIFPDMFLSKSMDGLNAVPPDLVIEEKSSTDLIMEERSHLVDNMFPPGGIGSTFQAFLTYMNKIHGEGSVRAVHGDKGQVCDPATGEVFSTQCEKVLEQNDTSVTQLEELRSGALSHIEPLNSGLVGGSESLHPSSSMDDDELRCYKEIGSYLRGTEVQQSQTTTAVFDKPLDDKRILRDSPVYNKVSTSGVEQDQTIGTINPSYGILGSVRIVNRNMEPQSSKSLTAASNDVRLSPIGSFNEGQGTEAKSYSPTCETASDDMERDQLTVGVRTDNVVSNYILPNRTSVDVDVSLVQKYMKYGDQEGLLRLLAVEAGGLDQLIKILVSEIGQETLMRIFPTISPSDIESSLAKESHDIVVKAENTLLKHDEQGNLIVASLLKTFISYALGSQAHAKRGLPIAEKRVLKGGSVAYSRTSADGKKRASLRKCITC